MSTTQKAFDLAVLAYGAFSIAVLLPIVGGFVSAGADILNVPSWVFGAGACFLIASAICFQFCDETNRGELRKAAPALLALALMSLPVYLLTGFVDQAQNASAINLSGMSKTIGRLCIGFSIFFAPLIFWLVSLGAIANTIKSRKTTFKECR